MVWKPMPFLWKTKMLISIKLARATIIFFIGVKNLLICPRLLYTDFIIIINMRCEITHNDHLIGFTSSVKCYNALFHIMRIDPFKSLRLMIKLEKFRVIQIKVIQILHVVLHACMERIIQEMPVYLLL